MLGLQWLPSLKTPTQGLPGQTGSPSNRYAKHEIRNPSQLRKLGCLLRDSRHHSLSRILRLQHGRVPNTRIPQPILHTPIPAPIQNLLRPLHRNGTLTRHQLRPPQCFPHDLLLAPNSPHPTHEPHFLRLLGPKGPRAETNILNPTATPYDLRQPTQRPYIRRDANIHLFDTKNRILRTNPDITADADIDTEPQTPAMDRSYDRFLARFDSSDTSLEGVDMSAQLRRGPRAVEGRV